MSILVQLNCTVAEYNIIRQSLSSCKWHIIQLFDRGTPMTYFNWKTKLTIVLHFKSCYIYVFQLIKNGLCIVEFPVSTSWPLQLLFAIVHATTWQYLLRCFKVIQTTY